MAVKASLKRILAPLTVGLAAVLLTQILAGPTDSIAAERPLNVDALHEGDAGVYEVEIIHRDGSRAGPLSGFWKQYSFEIQEAGHERDVNGAERAVHSIQANIEYHAGGRYTGAHMQTSLDANTAQPVSQTFRWHSSTRAPLSLDGVIPPATREGHFTTFRPDATLCGLLSSLQTQKATAGQEVTLHGGCGSNGPLQDHDAYGFRLMGVEEVADTRTWHYQGIDESRAQAWYAEGLPVPVQIRLPATADGKLRSAYDMTLTLQTFHRGDKTAEVPHTGDGADMAPVRTSTWNALHGPDASESGHPFPISDAISAARSDPRAAPLILFLRDHPEAYLYWAQGRSVQNNGLTEYQWNLAMTDGKESIFYRIARTAGVTSFEEVAGALDASRTPLPDQLPPRLPQVAPAIDRWRDISDDVTGNVDYSFGIHCSKPGCEAVDAYVHVGMDRVTGGFEERDLLAVDAAGEPLYRTRHSDAGLDLLANVVAPDEAPRPDDAPASVSTWLRPSPAIVAASVATGLLASLAFAAAAAMKSGGWTPLFTRVRKDELLDNPLRQAIIDTIQGEPGIHFQALVRKLERSRGVLGHHIEKLEAAGLVQRSQTHGYVCFFLPDAGKPLVEGAAAVKAPAARRILESILSQPGTTIQAMSHELGLAASTVHGHVHRMLDAGIIESWQDGRTKRLKANPIAASLGGGA